MCQDVWLGPHTSRQASSKRKRGKSLQEVDWIFIYSLWYNRLLACDATNWIGNWMKLFVSVTQFPNSGKSGSSSGSYSSRSSSSWSILRPVRWSSKSLSNRDARWLAAEYSGLAKINEGSLFVCFLFDWLIDWLFVSLCVRLALSLRDCLASPASL